MNQSLRRPWSWAVQWWARLLLLVLLLSSTSADGAQGVESLATTRELRPGDFCRATETGTVEGVEPPDWLLWSTWPEPLTYLDRKGPRPHEWYPIQVHFGQSKCCLARFILHQQILDQQDLRYTRKVPELLCIPLGQRAEVIAPLTVPNSEIPRSRTTECEAFP